MPGRNQLHQLLCAALFAEQNPPTNKPEQSSQINALPLWGRRRDERLEVKWSSQ